MSNVEAIKQDMVCVAKRCSDRNAQTGDGGNISVRLDDNLMMIMASKSSFADCNEDSFVITDFESKLIEGKIAPSRESILHAAIYKKFKNVNAIVHCHSPYATAWASTMQTLPFSTYHSKVKLIEPIRVFDTESYIVSKEKVEEIIAQYEQAEDIRGFLLKKHGVFALGADIFKANYTFELIEETAQIHIISQLLKPTQTIELTV